jgi:hypothetical protein
VAQQVPAPAIVRPNSVAATPTQPAQARKAAAKPKSKSKAAPKPKAKAKAKRKPRVVAANGLPMAVATQLAKHGVVVVALYAGGADLDEMARDEAQAGASDARVGFAAVNAADKRAIEALTRKVEVLEAPAVFVLGRNGGLLARFDGFADRLMVAQLASSVS